MNLWRINRIKESLFYLRSSVKSMRKIKVFISSKIEENEAERQRAKQIHPEIFETFVFELETSSPKPVTRTCLDEVRESDIFVLILSKTLSQGVIDEYDCAKVLNIPMLVFIRKTEKDDQLLDFIRNEFKSNPSQNPIYREFETAEEFFKLLTDSLLNFVVSRFYEISEFEDAINKLVAHSLIADFQPMERVEVKSPLELIKSAPKTDPVLPLMSKISNEKSIPKQIENAHTERFVELYSNSWADLEQQLIGFFILRNKLEKYFDKITDMYDAGCGNCAQYKAVYALNRFPKKKVSEDFEYYGQDFNPDWKEKFKVREGEFIKEPLPLVRERLGRKYSLVCCTHTLHYLKTNPLGMYCCLFSFNKILKMGGYCYITVPEKTSLPGMLDLLLKGALDAKFEIIESGKCRLIHKLREAPGNITTFSFLIIKKIDNIEEEQWKRLAGASLYKANKKDEAEELGIQSDKDFKDLDILEMDLSEILLQRDPCLRTFRYALDIIHNKWKDILLNLDNCKKNILKCIWKVHEEFIKPEITEDKSQLKSELVYYFFWLVGFCVCYFKHLNPLEQVHKVYPIVKRAVNSRIDKRINFEDEIQINEVAWLLKHFFELCRYVNIDLRETFDQEDFSIMKTSP